MELATFTDRLDERLRTAAYAELDASANGLQIGPTDEAVRERDPVEIDRVAFAVDAAQATIGAAGDRGADLLVAHHGIVWGGLDRVTGRAHDRVTAATDRDLAVYVSHLPLDGHPELGNAARLADELGLLETAPFGELGPEHVGRRGRFAEPVGTDALVNRIDGVLPDGDRATRTIPFGPDEIETIGIVTGSGADWLTEAADAGLDALITGEGEQRLYHEAREAGVTAVLAGHYRTETLGVRALADLVADWGLDAIVLDHPTGL